MVENVTRERFIMTFVLQFKVSCQQFKGVSVIMVTNQGKQRFLI